MKSFSTTIAQGIAKVAYQVTKNNANSTCDFFFYQAELPKEASKLSKF